MIVITRYRVTADQVGWFRSQAESAVSVLQAKIGFVSADLARNVDETELWTITTRWADIGSYRRALQGFESKSVVVPLLSLAIDEPSAYEHPDLI